jgi:hypothetical protein
LVASRTHDLLNLVQIVKLAVIPLREACGSHREILDELDTSADRAHRSLTELMAVARPVELAPGAPVGATVASVLGTLRAVHALEIHVTVDSKTTTACTEAELEHLLIGLVLDAIDEPAITIQLRERVIDDQPWIEILRTTRSPATGDGFELRAVTAIAARAGGELATSDTRDGDSELVIALPVVT